MSINYRCPDCGENILHNQNFCNKCGCKIDWSDENNETELNLKDYNVEYKEKNVFKLPLFLIAFQFFAYICGLLTKNFDFNILSGDELIEFLGYNFIIIIAIVLFIKKRKYIKDIYIHKINIFLIIVSVILLCATIYIDIKNINIIDRYKEENVHYEINQGGNTTIINDTRISQEKFFEYKELYENNSIEIWVSGEIEDVLYDEIIITNNGAYRITKMFNNPPRYDFYEINFKKNGNKVTISYDDVIINGKIISNKMELYMEDGETIYADYEKN